MSRKEEILRRAAEMQRQEKTSRKPPDRPYDGSGMVSRMPLGCWLWILGLSALVLYAFSRFIGGVH
jgi:hypothetical protein